MNSEKSNIAAVWYSNQGITLIALIITIIVMLILAGVVINLTIGERGIFNTAAGAAEEYTKSQLKEELELAIQQIEANKLSEGKTIQREDLKELVNIGAVVTSTQIPAIGEYKGYEFEADENYIVTIGEKTKPKVETLTFSEIIWNNGKAEVTISTNRSEKIEYQINGTEGTWTQGEEGQKSITITDLNYNDIIYARLTDIIEEEYSKLVILDTIVPEPFTISLTDITETGVIVSGSTIDNQSGIKDYTYVAESLNGAKIEVNNITTTTYEFLDLNPSEDYKIYMIAYDKAGNSIKSENYEIKDGGPWSGQYFIFEVYDHLGGNNASISEIEFYDINNDKLNYTIEVDQCYDSARKNVPTSWKDMRYWNYTNLYDGEIEYNNNSQGGQNCTVFIAGSPNTACWARFLINLNEEKDLTDIRVCIGDVENRTPKSISIYKVNRYTTNTYSNNISSRKNNGLQLIGSINFSKIVKQPTWYSFMK